MSSDRDRPRSSGSVTLVRGFADRALEAIGENRDDMKALRQEWLQFKGERQARDREMEHARRHADDQHDADLRQLRAELAQIKLQHTQEVSTLRREFDDRIAAQAEKHGDKINELDKAIAVAKARGMQVGAGAGAGLGGLIGWIASLF